MQTLSTGSSISRLGQLAHIIAYNIFCFGLILLLVAGHDRLPSFAALASIPLLWLCTRRRFWFRPRLPEQCFNRVESWLWFGGAVACGLMLLGCAYAMGVRGALGLFQAMAIGVVSWAFLFLTFRDCRRTVQRK